jgi:hypothetical protein
VRNSWLALAKNRRREASTASIRAVRAHHRGERPVAAPQQPGAATGAGQRHGSQQASQHHAALPGAGERQAPGLQLATFLAIDGAGQLFQPGLRAGRARQPRQGIRAHFFPFAMRLHFGRRQPCLLPHQRAVIGQGGSRAGPCPVAARATMRDTVAAWRSDRLASTNWRSRRAR